MDQSHFTELTLAGTLPDSARFYTVECSGTFQDSTQVHFERDLGSLSERQVYQLARDIRRARRLFRAAQKADERS